jgi:PST family polysaccharide transporter
VTASAVTVVASATSLGVGLVRAKATALLVGTSGTGLLANLGIYNALAVSIGSAVAGQGAMRAMAAARAREENDRLEWLTSWVLAAPALIGLALFGLTALAAPFIAERITGSPDDAPLLVLSALAIPIGLAAGSGALILQTFKRIAALARISIATAMLSAATAIGLTILFGLPGAVAGLVALPAFRLVLLVREAADLRPRRWHLPPPGERRFLLPILSLGLASVVVGVTSALSTLIIRSIVVRDLGLDANGIYQPVAAISGAYLEVFIASTSFYLFPRLTELDATGRRRQFALELGHGMRLLLSLAVPAFALVIGLSGFVVTALYSSAFGAAAEPLAIQMSGSALKVIAWSIGAGLLPLGRYRAWAVIALATTGVQLAMSLILMPVLGLNALAFAYVAAWGLSAVAATIVIARSGVLPPGRDWALAAVGVAIPAVTLGVLQVSPQSAAVVAVLASAAWVWLVRRDLAELRETMLAPIRRRRGGA